MKGRLVYCKGKYDGTDSVIKNYGGIGTIIESERYLDVAQIFIAPATTVNYTTGEGITKYIQSTR